MKFIHTADIHLGAEPDAGSSYTAKRPEELWNSFERLLNICEEEQTDLLLIAGDLFHRQPLLRELKELDYLFSRLTHTQVVLMAGNHDYLKSTSYYRNYKWQGPVHMFLSQKPACMEFKELGVRIYGLSYEEREITEPLYEKILPEKRGIASILLAHGGDEKHIPFRKNELLKLGYDYIALGHVHKPQKVPGCPQRTGCITQDPWSLQIKMTPGSMVISKGRLKMEEPGWNLFLLHPENMCIWK